MSDTKPNRVPQCPQIDRRLLDHLKKLFPVSYPTPATGDRDIWIGRGKLDVIQYLEREYAKQNEMII